MALEVDDSAFVGPNAEQAIALLPDLDVVADLAAVDDPADPGQRGARRTLSRAGHVPNRVHTTAKVHLDKGDAGFRISAIELETEADVPGIDDAAFQKEAAAAKVGCPVSQALAAVDITLNARLV